MQKLEKLLKYCGEQFKKEWNLQWDNVVRKIFNENPNNTDAEAVLLKVVVLNSLYQTYIFDVDKMKEHIVRLGGKLDLLLKSGDLEAVNHIRHNHKIRYNNEKETDMDAYSFSTKYCHWSNPYAYPLMDQYVYKAIMKIKKDALVGGFKGDDLWDINEFKRVIDSIRENSGIKTYKEIDESLWIYGHYNEPSI